MSALVDHLHQQVEIAAFFAELNAGSREHWGRVPRFVLEHGRAYEYKPLPDGVAYGPLKDCFANATTVAAEASGRLVYCEGYAYTPGLALPLHHAWVVDREDGRAIDPTWRNGGWDCGFCADGILRAEDGDERSCEICSGTGRAEREHPSREGSEYFGVEVPYDLLQRIIVMKGTYGVLDSTDGLELLVEQATGYGDTRVVMS